MAPPPTLHLDCDLAQLTVAREWTRALLGAAGVEASDALLVVTELLTNAITHARSSPTMTLTMTDHTIHLEVTDGLSTAPTIRDHPNAHGGYGLRFVDQLTADWGWRAAGDGKVIWADLPRRAD